jgi:hypothetical protein
LTFKSKNYYFISQDCVYLVRISKTYLKKCKIGMWMRHLSSNYPKHPINRQTILLLAFICILLRCTHKRESWRDSFKTWKRLQLKWP